MTNTILFKFICYAFGFLLFCSLPACGGGTDKEPEDTGTEPGTAERNHCSLTVTGDADAGGFMEHYEIDEDITGKLDTTVAMDTQYTTAQMELTKTRAGLSCGHMEMNPVKQVGLSIELPKTWDQLIPLHLTEADTDVVRVTGTYLRAIDNHVWHCFGPPGSKPDAAGTWTLDIDKATREKRDDIAIMYVVRGTGHFECPASESSTAGVVTFDVTF